MTGLSDCDGRFVLEFTTGTDVMGVTVVIQKTGQGSAFADDIGLVPSFSWLEVPSEQ